MPAHNPNESLFNLGDNCLEVVLSISELQQTQVRASTLDKALSAITSEFHSWGLEDLKAFTSLPLAPVLCWEILRERDGEEAWPLRPGTSTREVYAAFYVEHENLLKILAQEEGADLKRAREFCLLLHQVGCAYGSPGRFSLAA